MSARPLLPIVRYWAPSGSQPRDAPLFGISDALLHRALFRPQSRTLEELADVGCLFLLGEPALGKSTAIHQEVERLNGALPSTEHVIAIDLAEVSSDTTIDAEFQTRQMQEWIDGTTVLHLYLDSYDECFRHYPTLSRRLIRNLRNLPLDRLRLRIACRSGEFPGSLLQEITGFFPGKAEDGTESILLIRLEPLSGEDIRIWADAEAVPDVDAFLAEVQMRNASTFAQRPVTLNALITAFKRGEFPSSEVALFTFASRALSSETNGDRGRETIVPAEGRFALAERIAALMTIAGKDRLWLGPPTATLSDAMSLAEVAGGDEVVDGSRFAADSLSILEVVERCAIFEVHDAQLVRWSQQAFREFLVASYFARRLEHKVKALQFFEHPGRPGSSVRLIAPQLGEPVAWLAAMDESVAALVAERDPIVLLRAQHFIHPSIRPTLARWLLEVAAGGRAVSLGWTAERARESVCYDGLSSELAAILNDGAAHAEVRALASWLAGACQFKDLASAVLAIAHDDAEALSTRWAAVLALEIIGDEADKRSLRPLLESIDGDSAASHRLRAQVLRTLWPIHKTTSEALDYLREHQRSSTDEYRDVFRGNFAPVTDSAVLAEALAWMSADARHEDDPLEWHFEEILVAASQTIDDNGVRAALARTLVARAQNHSRLIPYHATEFFQRLVSYPSDLRASLVDAIATDFADRGANSSAATYHLKDLITRVDLPYDQLVSVASKAVPGNVQLWWTVLTSDGRTWASLPGEHPVRRALADPDLDTPPRELFTHLDAKMEASHAAFGGTDE